jgi:hypothetical protein
MESAETTSPLWALAISTASFVFPEAVGPSITKIFGGMENTAFPFHPCDYLENIEFYP